jgi:hypothetical protein
VQHDRKIRQLLSWLIPSNNQAEVD